MLGGGINMASAALSHQVWGFVVLVMGVGVALVKVGL